MRARGFFILAAPVLAAGAYALWQLARGTEPPVAYLWWAMAGLSGLYAVSAAWVASLPADEWGE